MMGLLFNWLAGTAGEWIKTQAGIARTKAEARAHAVSNGIPGYSDEYLVLVWSLPVVLSFIPGMAGFVAQGFSNLNALPEWYVAGFISISFAVFGIDKLFAWKAKK